MGWTSPRTWNVGEIVTKAIMDLHIKDNLRYLKGLDGDVTIEDDILTAHKVDGIDVSKLGDGSQAYENLGSNGGFEIGDPPTGWILEGAGATLTRSQVQVKIGAYSAALTRAGEDCRIQQAVSNPARYTGRSVTHGCWVWASVANRACISIREDTGHGAESSYHTGGSTWEWLTVTYTLIWGAVGWLRPECRVYNGDTIAYFDGSVIVEGSICPAFTPSPRLVELREKEHHNLDGLTDDDHTQYQKENLLTTEGDIPYATANSTWERLPKGTAGQVLVMNGGATAPSWASAQALTASGNYTGDGTVNKAIAHGLGVAPKIVFIAQNVANYWHYRIMTGWNYVQAVYSGGDSILAVTAMDATNFYVGNATQYEKSANYNGSTYYWVALG